MSVDWNALRAAEFPVAEQWAYFDHAAVASMPRRAADRIRAWLADQQANGVVNWPDWEKSLISLRRNLARLVHCEAAEIALVNSTTQGLGIIAEGFPWRPGDNVVTAEEEYPSNIYPWMNLADRGVTLRTVPSRDGRLWVDDFARAIDAHTRLLTISHVEWSSGFRNDLDALAELCQSRGIALCVDAIQGLGPLTIDLSKTPIDFLAADGHKWLLGPEGAGFVFIRRSWIDRLRPTGVGWHSVNASYNTPGIHFELKPTAERWEGGSFAMPGLQGFSASVELFLEIGPEVMSARVMDRAERVRELARQAGWSIYGSERPEDLSAIVVLEKPGVDPEAFVRDARSRHVALSNRRGRVRVSPHCYNDESDLQRLGDLLGQS